MKFYSELPESDRRNMFHMLLAAHHAIFEGRFSGFFTIDGGTLAIVSPLSCGCEVVVTTCHDDGVKLDVERVVMGKNSLFDFLTLRNGRMYKGSPKDVMAAIRDSLDRLLLPPVGATASGPVPIPESSSVQSEVLSSQEESFLTLKKQSLAESAGNRVEFLLKAIKTMRLYEMEYSIYLIAEALEEKGYITTSLRNIIQVLQVLAGQEFFGISSCNGDKILHYDGGAWVLSEEAVFHSVLGDVKDWAAPFRWGLNSVPVRDFIFDLLFLALIKASIYGYSELQLSDALKSHFVGHALESRFKGELARH